MRKRDTVVWTGTVRTSCRIMRRTVSSRSQPTSAALRMLSPRRWKRQVAKEYPNISRVTCADTMTAISTAVVNQRSPVVSRAMKVMVRGPSDHRNRERSHADDGVDVRIERERDGPHRRQRIRKQQTTERAHEQRGKEQPAAKTGAQ